MARLVGFFCPKKIAPPLIRERGLSNSVDYLNFNGKMHQDHFDSPDEKFFIRCIRRSTETDRFFVNAETGIAVALDGNPQMDGRQVTVQSIAQAYYEGRMNSFAGEVDGAWIAVLYDPREQRLLLFRDRAGLKPIYYCSTDIGVAFSSNAAAILRLGWVKPLPCNEVVVNYAMGNYRGVYGRSNTFFQGIQLLGSSSLLDVSEHGVTESLFWDFSSKAYTLEVHEERLAASYISELEKAIRSALMLCTENFVVALSGGLDSGTIIGMLHRILGKKVDAISCTYGEPTEFDETDWIRPSVEMHVARWHNVKPNGENLVDELPRLYDRFEQPLATVSQFVQDFVCRSAREAGYSQLFSGAGGDYLQAGNYPNYLFHLADLKASGNSHRFEHEFESWIKNHSTSKFPKTRETLEQFFLSHIDWTQPGVIKSAPIPLTPARQVLHERLIQDALMTPRVVPSYGSYLRSYTVQDFRYEGAAPCIPSEDISGWLHGVEAIEPFFFGKLVNFGWGIPSELKIRDGMSKILARRAMRGIVPEAILTRKTKSGWNAPSDQWFREPAAEYTHAILTSKAFRERGIYNPDEILQVWTEHREGRANHMMLIWQALNLELWMQTWID